MLWLGYSSPSANGTKNSLHFENFIGDDGGDDGRLLGMTLQVVNNLLSYSEQVGAEFLGNS